MGLRIVLPLPLPKVVFSVRLSCPLAQELVLCAVLSPVAATDLAAQQSEEAYATDASLARCAVCRCVLPRSVNPVPLAEW